MRLKTDRMQEPELLAVVALPSLEELRRREVLLVRLMLVAIDLVLSGEGLGLETARDLIREVQHTYPELLAERNASELRGDESVQRQNPCCGEAASANGNVDGGSAKPVEQGENQIDAADHGQAWHDADRKRVRS